MRLFSLALAASLFASSAFAAAAPLPSGVTVSADWSAGYEEAYLEICDVTPAERAAWASPIVKASSPSSADRMSGFLAAFEDLDGYQEAGFDAYEYCGDNQP